MDWRRKDIMLYFNSCLIVVLLVISNFSSLSNASSTSAALRLNEMVVTKAMQSPEVFTNVMSELKDVALTLKTGQEEDAAMTARVKNRCDNSVFRVKHALEMIEKDCGGLSSQQASVEKQIQSLSATRDPLVSSPTMTKSIGAFYTRYIKLTGISCQICLHDILEIISIGSYWSCTRS